MAIQTSSFVWEDSTINVHRLTIRQAKLERPSLMTKVAQVLGFENDRVISKNQQELWGLIFSFANIVLQTTPSKPVTWWCKADASNEEFHKAYEAFLDSPERLWNLLIEHIDIVNGDTQDSKNE